jgi:queuine tRNA-ribosyltransferase
MFELEAMDGKARAGLLRTAHGKVQTPAFMPVATKAVVKTLTPEEVYELGARALICNAFHLHLRPGIRHIRQMGGVHEFMGWGQTIFSDSGGFQLIRGGFDLKIRESGIRYRHAFTGAAEELTPEGCVLMQRELGSDVAMMLDDCPRYGASPAAIRDSCRRTIDWARRAADVGPDEDGQKLFGIVQGGWDERLRKECVDRLVSLDLDGYGIGGLSIGEPKPEMLRAMRWALEALPGSKPRYLMGVGSAAELLEAIYEGVDIFDSAFPTRNARHWTVMTAAGNYALGKAENAAAAGPLEDGCGCPTCRRFTKAYLHHLCRENDMLGMRLLSVHNLFFVQELVRDARDAIARRRFGQFREQAIAALPRPMPDEEE